MDKSEHDAEKYRVDARIRTIIKARNIEVLVVEIRHERSRRRTEHENKQYAKAPPDKLPTDNIDAEDDRKDEIELKDDADKPEMRKR